MILEEDKRHLMYEDPEIFAYIMKEKQRQEDGIELIASENFTSEAVMEAMGSILTNKYAEGYPEKRYYGGCENVDKVEQLAIERAKKLFGAEYANVQPHSGAQANLAVYQALLKPGDTVLAMSLQNGGHLTHGSKVNESGKLYNFIEYGVTDEGYIGYDEVERLALEHLPRLIICGASAYPRTIDFKRFREIVDKVNKKIIENDLKENCGDGVHGVRAYTSAVEDGNSEPSEKYKWFQEHKCLLMADMAHIAGLVAAGLHQNPVKYADIVTSTTHKTLRGPRGGIILAKQQFANKINSAVFPGTQGGPLEHVIAGKAVCFKEAMKPEFIEYQKQVVANCKRLASKLKEYGFNLITDGTDNHLILIDLRDIGITGLQAQAMLEEVGITANKNAVPNDKEKPMITSGLRLGTAAVTTRGFKEKEMDIIAACIYYVLQKPIDVNIKLEDIKIKIKKMCEEYPIYYY